MGYTAATMGGAIAAVVAAMPMREGYDGFSSPDTSDVSLGHRCLPLTVNDPQGGVVAAFAEMKEEDVNAFSNVPLVPVGPGSYVKFEHRGAGEQLSDALPFRVDDHPDAQSWVAKSMLERFNVDMAKYAASVNASQKPSLICIDSECGKCVLIYLFPYFHIFIFYISNGLNGLLCWESRAPHLRTPC